MGAPGAARGSPGDSVMDEKITPFRMNQLMEVAAKVTKLMVTGIWHLSYEEMEIVLKLVHCGMNESMEKNKEEEQCS